MKNCSNKLEYRFLAESTKIENRSFTYETVTLEANIKTNRMLSTKCTYQKEGSFAGNYFFLKILFQFKNLIYHISTSQMSIFVLYASVGVLFDGAFSL